MDVMGVTDTADAMEPARHWCLPAPRPVAFAVWRRLMLPGLLLNFGEPFLYLLGLGFGLGRFIGEMDGIGYFAFLASGLVASSSMMTASDFLTQVSGFRMTENRFITYITRIRAAW